MRQFLSLSSCLSQRKILLWVLPSEYFISQVRFRFYKNQKLVAIDFSFLYLTS